MWSVISYFRSDDNHPPSKYQSIGHLTEVSPYSYWSKLSRDPGQPIKSGSYVVWDLCDVRRRLLAVTRNAASLGVTQQVDDERKALHDFLERQKYFFLKVKVLFPFGGHSTIVRIIMGAEAFLISFYHYASQVKKRKLFLLNLYSKSVNTLFIDLTILFWRLPLFAAQIEL